MGTRADYYIGRGEHAEWIGSIAWDGHVESQPSDLICCLSEEGFREAVARFLQDRDDATTPEMGWPWPWENSQTTDYAYAFDGHKVWASCFGMEWFDPLGPEPVFDDDTPQVAVFPDMRARRNLAEAGTQRSGVIVIQVPRS